MKLDNWPEEVEVDGWRWTLRGYWIDEVPPDGYLGPRYIRKEKLHVPPTMREIMEHLLKGGWVKRVDSSTPGDYYFRIGRDRELEECYKNRKLRQEQWSNSDFFARYPSNKDQFFLINIGEWFEGEGK